MTASIEEGVAGMTVAAPWLPVESNCGSAREDQLHFGAVADTVRRQCRAVADDAFVHQPEGRRWAIRALGFTCRHVLAVPDPAFT